MDIGGFASLFHKSTSQPGGEAARSSAAQQLQASKGSAAQSASGLTGAGRSVVALSGGLASMLRRQLGFTDRHQLILKGDAETGELWIEAVEIDPETGQEIGDPRSVPLDGRLSTVVARHWQSADPLFDLSA